MLPCSQQHDPQLREEVQQLLHLALPKLVSALQQLVLELGLKWLQRLGELQLVELLAVECLLVQRVQLVEQQRVQNSEYVQTLELVEFHLLVHQLQVLMLLELPNLVLSVSMF
jgi:hypothetical protein